MTCYDSNRILLHCYIMVLFYGFMLSVDIGWPTFCTISCLPFMPTTFRAQDMRICLLFAHDVISTCHHHAQGRSLHNAYYEIPASLYTSPNPKVHPIVLLFPILLLDTYPRCPRCAYVYMETRRKIPRYLFCSGVWVYLCLFTLFDCLFTTYVYGLVACCHILFCSCHL